MKLLLDTHTLIWAALSPQNLSGTASAALSNEQNELLISAATAWEITTKVRLGKLPGAEALEQDLLPVTRRAGYEWLPIAEKVAVRAGRLVGKHKDPFDRMIAAQALELGIALVGNDRKMDEFGVQRIW